MVWTLFLVKDWQILRPDAGAVADRLVADILFGAFSHLRQGIGLVGAGKWRVVRKGCVAARASPPREKSSDSTDIGADQYEESTGARSVESKMSLAVGSI